jgi:hypothetical protein
LCTKNVRKVDFPPQCLSVLGEQIQGLRKHFTTKLYEPVLCLFFLWWCIIIFKTFALFHWPSSQLSLFKRYYFRKMQKFMHWSVPFSLDATPYHSHHPTLTQWISFLTDLFTFWPTNSSFSNNVLGLLGL